jgi:hypothetical protein
MIYLSQLNTGLSLLTSQPISGRVKILFGSGSGLDVFQIPPHRQAVFVI